jgi:hypothetical protein
MDHLTPEELLEVAEGTQSAEVVPHLASCEACRRELSDLQGAFATARAVEVPEPSPLFWDHLSARVRAAVDAESSASTERAPFTWPGWRLALSFGAVAVVGVVLAVWLPTRFSDTEVAVRPETESAAPVQDPLAPDLVPAPGDDPSVDLMADLTGDWDWEFAAEAGLTAREGAVEALVQELSDDERTELRRLLEEELSSRSGA